MLPYRRITEHVNHTELEDLKIKVATNEYRYISKILNYHEEEAKLNQLGFLIIKGIFYLWVPLESEILASQ